MTSLRAVPMDVLSVCLIRKSGAIRELICNTNTVRAFDGRFGGKVTLNKYGWMSGKDVSKTVARVF